MSEIVAGTSINESFTEGTVTLDVSGRSRFKGIKTEVRLIGPDGRIEISSTNTSEVINGSFNFQSVLTIQDPDLWWPRGYGDQKLYKIEIDLLVNGIVHQKEYRTIGFRKITFPENLHFIVNGVPVFLRGGAWATPDLLSDVWDQEREEMLFSMY